MHTSDSHVVLVAIGRRRSPANRVEGDWRRTPACVVGLQATRDAGQWMSEGMRCTYLRIVRHIDWIAKEILGRGVGGLRERERERMSNVQKGSAARRRDFVGVGEGRKMVGEREWIFFLFWEGAGAG